MPMMLGKSYSLAPIFYKFTACYLSGASHGKGDCARFKVKVEEHGFDDLNPQ